MDQGSLSLASGSRSLFHSLNEETHVSNVVINQRDRNAMLEHNGNILRIDRGTKWGNHFGDTQEGRRRYRAHLWQMLDRGDTTIAELQSLDGKALAGWEAPNPCHGDILARAIAWAKSQPEQLSLDV